MDLIAVPNPHTSPGPGPGADLDADPDLDRTPVEIEDYEFRSPSRLIRTVAARVPLEVGAAYAVLVRDPSRRQQVVAVERLEAPSTLSGDDEDALRRASEEVRLLSARWEQRVGRYPMPNVAKVVTVLVREGWCVWGPHEWAWCHVWREGYRPISGGEIVVVTEHGWLDLFTGHADHAPAALALERPAS